MATSLFKKALIQIGKQVLRSCGAEIGQEELLPALHLYFDEDPSHPSPIPELIVNQIWPLVYNQNMAADSLIDALNQNMLLTSIIYEEGAACGFKPVEIQFVRSGITNGINHKIRLVFKNAVITKALTVPPPITNDTRLPVAVGRKPQGSTPANTPPPYSSKHPSE